MRYEYSTLSEAFKSERPVVLADSPDLNRTGNAVIWLSNVRVYSFGTMFTVSALTRQSDRGLMLGNRSPDDAPEGFVSVLFGVELGDGTPVALDRRGSANVVLEVRHSVGNPGSLQADLFLGPIPPPGPLRFVTAVPALGISEAMVSIEGQHIISASNSVKRLWTGTTRNTQGLGGAGLRGGNWFQRWD